MRGRDGSRHPCLGPATWDAYAALIERHNGVWGGCWCLVFHEGQKKDSLDDRRA
ncbi:MAG: hypothetical protein R3D59_09140 [Paracoccaceae bacterium]